MVFLACGDEPLGGGAFAIVLVVSVLLGDPLGCEGNDDVGVGMDKGSAHHRVRVGRSSVAVVGDTAGGTMDLVGTEGAGSVKRQQGVSPEYREVFPSLQALQVGNYPAEGRTQRDGINTVETFPQAGVRRGLVNAEEVHDHRMLGRLLPGIPVKVEKGGRLEHAHGDPDIMPSTREKPRCLIESGMEAKEVRTVKIRPEMEHAFEIRSWTGYCSIFEFVLVC